MVMVIIIRCCHSIVLVVDFNIVLLSLDWTFTRLLIVVRLLTIESLLGKLSAAVWAIHRFATLECLIIMIITTCVAEVSRFIDFIRLIRKTIGIWISLLLLLLILQYGFIIIFLITYLIIIDFELDFLFIVFKLFLLFFNFSDLLLYKLIL